MTYDYAKLTDDIRAAIDLGIAAAEGFQDSGSCNHDSPALFLPGARLKAIEAAVIAAGGFGAYKGTYAGKFIISIPSRGQALQQTRGAEATSRELERRGWKASVHYAMD